MNGLTWIRRQRLFGIYASIDTLVPKAVLKEVQTLGRGGGDRMSESYKFEQSMLGHDEFETVPSRTRVTSEIASGAGE